MTTKLSKRLSRLKSPAYRRAYVRAHATKGLAYQIRALREQRGWTQMELARRLGLSNQSAVARMEDPAYGKLSLESLLRLSDVFDVALLPRFVSFSKLIAETENLTPEALQVESFDAEIEVGPQATDRSDFAQTVKTLKARPLLGAAQVSTARTVSRIAPLYLASSNDNIYRSADTVAIVDQAA